MKNLIYKQFKLAIPKPVFLFSLLSFLVVIPNYPVVVGTMYFVFCIQICFETARANKDAEFTAMLPIPRKDVVKSKFITVLILQAAQLLVAVPAALISCFVTNKAGNIVGMDANFAYFGLLLIYYGVFDFLFFTLHFKDGNRMAAPFLASLSSYVVLVILFEILIAFVPALHMSVDGTDIKYIGVRLAVLAFGLIVFVALIIAAFKISVKRFEKANL